MTLRWLWRGTAWGLRIGRSTSDSWALVGTVPTTMSSQDRKSYVAAGLIMLMVLCACGAILPIPHVFTGTVSRWAPTGFLVAFGALAWVAKPRNSSR